MISIALPWPPTILSPNWTGKLAKKLRAKKRYRRVCRDLTFAQLTVPMRTELASYGDRNLHLGLRFFPPRRYHYDRDNLVARMKHGIDGACDAFGFDDRLFRTGNDEIFDTVKDGQVDLFVSLGPSSDFSPLPRPWSLN